MSLLSLKGSKSVVHGVRALVLFSICFVGHAFEVKPGLTAKIPCVGAAERTIDLFIPAAYMIEATEKFPVLFMSSPSGNPNVKSLASWAERQGVIIVGINSSKNGPSDNNIQAQEAALKTVEPELRMHACLRLAMGFSGGGMAAWLLVTRHPDNFAGLLMEGQCGFPNLPPKYIAVAYINGDKDPNFKFIENAESQLKRHGNPLQHLIKPGGHIQGTVEEQSKYLDWMLELGRMTHPKLSPADKASAKTKVQKQLADAAKIENAKACAAEMERLLELPTVAEWPESRAQFPLWLQAVIKASAGIEDKVEKHSVLNKASQRDWMQGVDAPTKRALEKELAELRKVPAVKDEYDADAALLQAEAAERNAGVNKAQLKMVQQMYDVIAQRFPKTAAAKKAEGEAARLKK